MLFWLDSVALVKMLLWQVFVALVDVALANICRSGMYVALEKFAVACSVLAEY